MKRSERITPAWAGKRFLRMTRCSRARDHPRVGGEKTFARVCGANRRGSPPRGRGKVHLDLRAILPLRITPAWAGKSEANKRIRDLW